MVAQLGAVSAEEQQAVEELRKAVGYHFSVVPESDHIVKLRVWSVSAAIE
jgi:hypothetical protein